MKREENMPQEQEPFSWKDEIISWIKIIITAAVIAFLLNNFIIANSRIPSGSMEKTIMTGDRVIGSRLSYYFEEPERAILSFSIFLTTPRVRLIMLSVSSDSREISLISRTERFI